MEEQPEPPQRTAEWFEKRKGRVTGSIVGAILGVAPYMTRADAMRSMVRAALGAPTEFTGNIATEYGNHYEPGAIVEFQMETGLRVKPATFVVHDDWLGASPDGFVSDGGLIEVKCPFGLRKEPNPQFKHPDDLPHYVGQMQVQMYVTRTKHCWFYQWSVNGTSCHKVDYDPEWINANLPILRQFHAEFLHELAENPDEYLAPKRIEIDTPEAAKMLAEWDEINEALERLAERKKDLLSEMVALAGKKNAILGGGANARKLTLTQKKGAIAYAKAIKALCPKADLEPYRGKASSFWGLR